MILNKLTMIGIVVIDIIDKKVEVLGALKKAIILTVIVALVTLNIVPAFATDEAITNGGFESGQFRWNIYADGFGTYDDFHLAADDAYTGVLGVHVPNSQPLGCIIVQNLSAPINVADIINFTIWVKGGIGDGTFWSGLVFNETGWIDNLLVLGAAGSADWTQLTMTDFSAYTGEKVTAVTITGYGGDGAGEDVYFDLVSLEVAEGAGGEWLDWTAPGVYDNLIGQFTAFVVPLFVVLLPAFLLMFLTRRADKWLLIIGIVIGAGLGYYFEMVPLWLVFLVTIGLIGMAYQSVRGGGNS